MILKRFSRGVMLRKGRMGVSKSGEGAWSDKIWWELETAQLASIRRSLLYEIFNPSHENLVFLGMILNVC